MSVQDEKKTMLTNGLTEMTNTTKLFEGDSIGHTYVPKRGSYGRITVNVIPELIGKRWCAASLALITGLNPTKIRVCRGPQPLNDCAGRVTVHLLDTQGIEVISSLVQEVKFELVSEHL